MQFLHGNFFAVCAAKELRRPPRWRARGNDYPSGNTPKWAVLGRKEGEEGHPRCPDYPPERHLGETESLRTSS